MKKLLKPYISYALIIFLVLAIIVYIIAEEFHFKIIHNVLYGIATVVVVLSISIRANISFFKTHDKRMAIFASGFLTAALFEILHFLNSDKLGLQFFYFQFEVIAYLSAIITSLFYSTNPIANKPVRFILKSYISYLSCLFIILLVVWTYGEDYPGELALNIPVESTITSLFFICAIVHGSIRKNLKLTPVSALTIGLIIYGIAEIYVPSQIYAVSTHRHINHIEEITGLIFLFIGFNDTLLKPKIISIRNKVLLYTALLVVGFFFIITLPIIIFTDIRFTIYTQYSFFAGFVIITLSEYVIASKSTVPILNITKEIEKNKPDQQPKKIEIISDDEIALLTEVFNKNAKLVWEYTQEIKEKSYKESLLREIVSEIKFSQTLESAYSYVIAKLTDIFKADRGIFFEMPNHKSKAPIIKYEHINRGNLRSLNDFTFPQACIDEFIEMTTTHTPLVVNNTKEFHSESREVQEYFGKLSIGSFVAIPLVRFNHDTTILGIITICTEKPRALTNNEIEFLKVISESVVTIIWEINKLIEIDELRESFIATLAHDLQVPILGEHKALEYILLRSDEDPIKEYKVIIKEIFNNNEQLTDQLKKLLNSYYYESNKKILNLEIRNISETIIDTYETLKDKADIKGISIILNIQENLPPIKLDEYEVKLVIFNFIDNAIRYTQEGGKIKISAVKDNNNIKICVSDNGPGISDGVKQRIFERYAASLTIEKKVGSGMGLYLCKQIIEAHGGEIFYSSELGVGSTFCFSLPLK